MLHRFAIALLAAANIGFAVPAQAAKLGTEFRVNTETGGDQEAPAVAVLTTNDFVIAWRNFGQSGQLGGIYFQRFGAAGGKKGGETRVNSLNTNVQSSSKPAIAPLLNGRFVVVWGGSDASSGGVFMRLYNANGVPLGNAQRCNTTVSNNQTAPAVTPLSGGGFMIAWQSSGQDGSGTGIFGQRFKNDGTKLGGEFPLNDYTLNDQTEPSLAGLANGGFVGVWNSFDQDHDDLGVFGRRFQADGDQLGFEFRGNPTTEGQQYGGTVAALPNSRFIVAWHSFGQDTSTSWGVYAQRFFTNDDYNGNEFKVNVVTAGDQMNPAIATFENGAFVIVWESANKDGSGKAIVGRRFNPNGTPDGGEFPVNTFKPNDQVTPAIARLPNGRFVVVWASENQDGSGFGVYAQRFSP